MHVRRRQFILGSIAAAGASLGLGAGAAAHAASERWAITPARLRTPPSTLIRAEWERLGLEGRVLRLLTPTSGAFFAVTARDDQADPKGGLLFRSDDAGQTWAPVPLPPQEDGSQPPNAFEQWMDVDPSNHDVMYADGKGGLYKTDDGGATWNMVVPTDTPVRRVAVSPADHDVVYAATAPYYPKSGTLRMVRSQDGGATWQQVVEENGAGCFWGVDYLSPHPTDPDRLFSIFTCVRSAHNELPLLQGRDQGRSWSDVPFPPPNDPLVSLQYSPQQARIAGGRGSRPSRLYAGANRPWEVGGCYVFRSDDDGATWTMVHSHRGGGTYFRELRDVPKVDLGAIVADPTDPDRLYVGLNEFANTGSSFKLTNSRVIVSTDAGATWSNLGQTGLATITDLALGVDGRFLYCGHGGGVSRFAL